MKYNTPEPFEIVQCNRAIQSPLDRLAKPDSIQATQDNVLLALSSSEYCGMRFAVGPRGESLCSKHLFIDWHEFRPHDDSRDIGLLLRRRGFRPVRLDTVYWAVTRLLEDEHEFLYQLRELEMACENTRQYEILKAYAEI